MRFYILTLLGLVVLIAGVFPFSGLSEKKRTIAVFYPSPYGEYKDLRTEFLAVGSDVMDAQNYPYNDGEIRVEKRITFGPLPQSDGIIENYTTSVGQKELAISSDTISMHGESSVSINGKQKVQITSSNSVTVTSENSDVLIIKGNDVNVNGNLCLNGECIEHWIDSHNIRIVTKYCYNPKFRRTYWIYLPDHTIHCSVQCPSGWIRISGGCRCEDPKLKACSIGTSNSRAVCATTTIIENSPTSDNGWSCYGRCNKASMYAYAVCMKMYEKNRKN